MTPTVFVQRTVFKVVPEEQLEGSSIEHAATYTPSSSVCVRISHPTPHLSHVNYQSIATAVSRALFDAVSTEHIYSLQPSPVKVRTFFCSSPSNIFSPDANSVISPFTGSKQCTLCGRLRPTTAGTCRTQPVGNVGLLFHYSFTPPRLPCSVQHATVTPSTGGAQSSVLSSSARLPPRLPCPWTMLPPSVGNFRSVSYPNRLV